MKLEWRVRINATSKSESTAASFTLARGGHVVTRSWLRESAQFPSALDAD
jgi:hypothetical protein